MWEAGRKGNTAEAKRLIQEGASVNLQDDLGWAPLHVASANGSKDIVLLLIEKKANINITNKHGDTALCRAAYHNQMNTARALVEAGADTTIRNGMGMIAATRAKNRGYQAVAEYLTNDAPHIRFHSSARDENGQLHRVKGRSLRAIKHDLEESGIFVNHMLYRLNNFCTGTHRKVSAHE